jgi:hypothetical protein
MLSIWSDFLVPRAGKLQSLRLCGNLCNGTAVARWSMRLKRNEANTQFGSDDDALELFGGKGFRTQPRQALASNLGMPGSPVRSAQRASRLPLGVRFLRQNCFAFE